MEKIMKRLKAHLGDAKLMAAAAAREALAPDSGSGPDTDLARRFLSMEDGIVDLLRELDRPTL